MNFYIQHGYGKSDKLDAIASDGNVQGVILSPADEDQNSLRATAQTVRGLGGQPMLDPQTYIYSTNPAGSARRHPDLNIDFGAIRWSQSLRDVAHIVEAVRDANLAVGITERFIAPSPVQSSFSDVWTTLALQYARAASDEWGSDNTFATVCIDYAALNDWVTIEDWLDVVTTLDVQGFYILVDRRSGNYPHHGWDAPKLRNLLRIIYTLSALNDYETIWGYSDHDGLLGLAAGATAISSGWSYGLRNFSTTKWQPSSGYGRAATPRLYLSRIWSPVRLIDEGAAIFESNQRDAVFPPWAVQRFANGDYAGWTNYEAQVNHLSLLSRRAARITREPSVADKCALVQKSLSDALDRIGEVVSNGVLLPALYRAKVSVLAEALDMFVAAENL